MMVEPGYMKCPDCGAPLEKKVMFNEKIVQCTKCDYKQPLINFDEINLNNHVLEESR